MELQLYGVLSGLNVRALLVGLLFFWLAFHALRRHRHRNLPPGPLGWPLLGYIPRLALTREPPHEILAKLSGRYGNVVSFSLANYLVVVLQDYDVMKEAFSQRELSGRPILEVSQITLPGYGVLSSSGEPWMELRRFAVTTLRGLGVGKSSFEEHITTETRCLLEAVGRTERRPFNPRHLLENAVSNVICSVVFGRRFDYDHPQFRRLLAALDRMFQLMGAGGVVQFVPVFARQLRFLPVVRRLIHVNLSIDEILYSLLFDREARLRQLAEGAPSGGCAEAQRDFAGAFLREMKARQEAGVPTYLSPASMHYTLGDLFGAGTETTSTTLRWAVLCMVGHPAVQARVQRELDGVVARDRLPRLADKPRLPYLRAVLSEVHRLGSIVPLGVPHKCLEDTTLRGYFIPKGTFVVANMWNVHRDPVEWPQPDQFRPERFLDPEGNFVSREKLIPFCLGRRVCLGEQLARMELYIIFSCLLHRFKLTSPEGAPAPTFRACNGITRAPETFEVCATPRDD